MTTRSPTGKRVFIAGLSHHDYEAAREFGDLFVVVSGNVDLDDVEDLRQRVTAGMESAEPGDYVLLSGAPIICIMCSTAMLNRYGFVNVLQWNAVERSYIPHRLELENHDAARQR